MSNVQTEQYANLWVIMDCCVIPGQRRELKFVSHLGLTVQCKKRVRPRIPAVNMTKLVRISSRTLAVP